VTRFVTQTGYDSVNCNKFTFYCKKGESFEKVLGNTIGTNALDGKKKQMKAVV
jgi:hypothetical protein